MRLNVTTALTGSTAMGSITLLALAGVTSGIPAYAQSDILLQLVQCRELPEDSERLACYDRLTVIESETNAAGNVESDAPPPTSATISNEASEPLEIAGSTAPEAGDPAAVVGSAAPVDTDVPRIATAAPALSEEDPMSAAVTQADDPELISVVSVRRNLSGLAVFQTADGELWVQTDVSSRRYPPVPFAARIERALLRGYFLRVQDRGFRVRVRQLQ